MALIKCPECGRDISDAAAACPMCGFPLDRLKTEDVRVVRTAVPAASAGETLLVVRRGCAFAAAILGTLAISDSWSATGSPSTCPPACTCRW